MKKHFCFLISLLSLVILVSCTSSVVLSPQDEPPFILDPIDDLSTLDSDKDLYIIRLLTDEDTQSLLKELKTYYNALDITDISNYYTVYNDLLEICNNNKYSVVKEKLENMILSSNDLLKENTLQAEVLGEAKETLINSLNSLVETGHSIYDPESLVFDYRDLIYLRLIAKSIIGIYDGKNAVDGWYETLEPIDFDDPWPYLLKEQAYQAIQNYQEYLDDAYSYKYPWKYEDPWLKLDELVEELAGITDPQDLLETDDLFEEETLILYGLDFAIEEFNFLTEGFNEIYIFEVERTDENGWTDDDKTSFYEYVFLLLSTDLEDISIKSYLNQQIEDLKVSEEVKEVKFGEVDLLKDPKKGDLLGELDSLLSNDNNDNLVMSTQWATETKQFLGRTVTEINASITLDFEELSNVPLDLTVNNLETEKDIIEVFIDEKIWEILSDGKIKSDKAMEILEKLLDKLAFGDSDEHSVTINLDDSITIIVDMDVKKYIF
ncbi:MAG: hypothetical protein SVO01_09835 [Thermotogota bacterium]|nr:hypothetical protein [Thermotogota bacterium]